MGEEKEVNLEKMTWGCLRDIQEGDVPEAFVFPDLYSSEERSELEERICRNQLSGHSQSSEGWMRCSRSMNLRPYCLSGTVTSGQAKGVNKKGRVPALKEVTFW